MTHARALLTIRFLRKLPVHGLRYSVTVIKLLSLVVAAASVFGCSNESVVVRENRQSISRSTSGALLVRMQSAGYVIRQGDDVEISVWGYPEFNTKTMVKQGGALLVPLVGELNAGGLTKEQFTNQLSVRLSQYIQGEPRISVSIASPTMQRVAVLGAVIRQDNYPITGEVSVVEILSSAGGATDESDLHRVKIIRFGNSEEPLVVDVASYIENGALGSIPMVRPGDTVFVPKKENVVREMSDFLRDVVLFFGFFRIFY